MRKLFSPIKIGDLEIKNRFVMAPMENCLAGFGGAINEQITAYFTERAKNDIGIIITGGTAVTPGADHPLHLRSLRLYDESLLPGMKRLVDSVHQAGAKFGIQLLHAGRQGSTIAPSAIPCCTALTNDNPREMVAEDFRSVLDGFVTAARRCIDIGFDLIELHFAHGYLMHQFLSPHSNKRTDAYGGSLENRMKYPLQILDAVIKEANGRVPVTIRISVEEFLEDGLGFDEAKTVCIEVEKHGAAAISISAGSYDSPEVYGPQPMFIPQGILVPYAKEVKHLVNVPVIVAGRLNDASLIERIIDNGDADMVAIGRGFIADPELAVKMKNEEYASINYCVACNQGCIDSVFMGQGLKCLVNPRAGYETTRNISPLSNKRKVLVIGAGPAGLEAAIIAKRRGHDVLVLDESDKIGGKLGLAATPPEKDSFLKFRDYLNGQMTALGIPLKQKEVTCADDVREFNADVIIVAVGATNTAPPFPIAEGAQVVMAEDVLAGKADVGKTVAVIGGGLVGAETAKYLCTQNKNVHIVEMLDRVGKEYGPTFMSHNLAFLAKNGVISHVSSKVVAVEKGKVILENDTILADSVIIAVGYQPNTTLAAELKSICPAVYTIGDAKAPRRILDAISEGFEIANKI
jgi:2,4-dienoyl-CoA reductase-like NADH-dependent reductase (Old Yellow Enzyme family)/thioredoxin reductase